jgi:hypothetical protein
MKYLVAVLCAILLSACGGGESPAFTSNSPLPFRLASPVSGDPEVALHLYQALYGKAPGYAQLNTFKNQIAANGAVAWANSTAASFDSLSNSAFAALVLNNISITPTSLTATTLFGTPRQAYDGLVGGFVEYLNYVGIANRGVVAAQLSEIISNLEIDTQFGVYGGAAVALNKQIGLNSTYSSNAANAVHADLSTPAANAGIAQTVATGSVVTLDGSASSDPNGDPLTYTWTLTSKPAGSAAALSAATSAKPAFTADVAGTYVVSLTVNDGKVSSTEATVSIAAAAQSLALYEVSDSFFYTTENLGAMPYAMSNSSSASITCVGNGCGTVYDIASFTLKASGRSFTITNLTATNSTAGSTIVPVFSGLANGQVIANGAVASFKLQSPFTRNATVTLNYSFGILETGKTFNYTVVLRTN